MADTKEKIKTAIDSTAEKAKEIAEAVTEKTKSAVHKTGEKIEEAGSAVKEKSE